MTRNAEMVEAVVAALGGLREEVVLVGGAAVELLVTDPAFPLARFDEEDVDLVVPAPTFEAWEALCARLRAAGAQEDTREEAPLSRWIVAGVPVDLMPTEASVLGYGNRWYPLALRESRPHATASGRGYRVASAPLFLAMKIEAFKGRGENDFAASRDVEDLVTVVAGRPTIAAEVREAAAELRGYLRDELGRWLADERFLRALPGCFAGGPAGHGRVPTVLGRLRAIAGG